MATQSQKNSQDIIKLQGETKLINQKIDTITHNHLHHLEIKINNIYKLLWVIATISLSSMLNFMSNIIS
tara:strand:+ start:293 stop:499 length:207 start_codon:yes stop_codon:yes gene_type:complete